MTINSTHYFLYNYQLCEFLAKLFLCWYKWPLFVCSISPFGWNIIGTRLYRYFVGSEQICLGVASLWVGLVMDVSGFVIVVCDMKRRYIVYIHTVLDVALPLLGAIGSA